MQRYLLRLAFPGHLFRGSQKSTKRLSPHLWIDNYIEESVKTVQGALEMFAMTLRPFNEIIASPASRVDAGVHALDFPVVLTLQKTPEGDTYYDPKVITLRLNAAFQRANIGIQVLKTVAVKGDFYSRNDVKARTYLYRFAVLNHQKLVEKPSKYFHHPLDIQSTSGRHVRPLFLPIMDQPFYTEVTSTFDHSKAEEALNAFLGCHNYYSVAPGAAKTLKIRSEVIVPEKEHFDRDISNINLRKIPAPIHPMHYPIYDNFDFYEFSVTSKSFFRSQVRMMAGLVFSVASGNLGLQKLKNLLGGDDNNQKPLGLQIASPNGLYLSNVEYHMESLTGSTDDLQKLPVLPQPLNEGPVRSIQWEEPQMREVMKNIFQQKVESSRYHVDNTLVA